VKIVFETVKADRARALIADQERQRQRRSTGKRPVGRPRKPHPEQTSQAG
jgi:hypothetical protein